MNNEIKVEEWNGYDIRFVLHEGEWWAVLADICKPLGLDAYDIKRQLGDGPVNTRYVSDALGIANGRDAVRSLNPKDVSLIDVVNTDAKRRKTQRMKIITTKVITKLAFRSHKKEAEEWNGYNIRFVLYEGKWWAVAKDVTDALGLGNPTKALYGIAGSEITLADLTNSKGSSPGSRKTQRMNVITTNAITRVRQ